uniref:Integrin subunit alpha E n=1 Tax=Loxodonta africana TaxID=9785 RepID=G3TQD9_LOXAF
SKWLSQGLCASFVKCLSPLVGFNVDVAQTWVTPEGAPFVLSSLLHQDTSTNQTWCLFVVKGRTTHNTGELQGCLAVSLPPYLALTISEHGLIPKGRHQGVTVVRNHHGVLICIQEKTRKSHSLSPELTGTCSLLAPNFYPRAQAYFIDLENLLDPDVHVDAGDCYRNKKSSIEGNENSARWRRQVELEHMDLDPGTEIAIILDGSGSIDPPDFQKAKDFISNMMRTIYDKCFECSFALVQYGGVIQTEFDLRDSQDVMASLARVQNIIQVKNVTKTASAMQHVLDNIFTPSHGSRKKAAKVMVVLTDGDVFQDPLNLTTVINSPKMQGVERFAIGVGDAFNKEQSDRELKLIASDPDETHAFKVTNYTALGGLLSKLQQSIIHTEGASGDALHFQLAQTGFSAQILDEEQVLLGAVGAFDWSGGALLYDTRSRRGRFLRQRMVDTKAAQYSYLGYSLAVLHRACGRSFVAGAPRHKQHGAVFELQKEGTEAIFLPVLEGEQMGSYFGSELCPVDIDMDGTTDFLLVAAPFYHVHWEEGRVYLYRLNQQVGASPSSRACRGHGSSAWHRTDGGWECWGPALAPEQNGQALGLELQGRRVGTRADCDGLHKTKRISPFLTLSVSLLLQRISASAVGPGLHYFGMSLAGGFDFSGDGLADITVGTLGRAVVLRSRPVVHLKVSVNFSPEALPIGFNGSVNVHLCFEISSGTPATETGLRETSLNFTLDVDVMKQRKRLQCLDVKTCLSTFKEWSNGSRLCERFQLLPTEGELYEEDRFSNISVKVSYQLQTPKTHRDHLYPILDLYTEPSAIFQLPYEKACKDKLFCEAKLQLTTTISQEELVVGLTKELTMNMNVTNAGEDSYMTNLTLTYPRNLQFKRIQKPPSPNIQCDDPKPVASILVMNCKIGHPIFKRSSADILVVWQLEEKAFPNRTADITVTITNSNERSSLPLPGKTTLRFKHAFIAVLTKPSVMYMLTSQRLSDHKEFLFNIHGENLFEAKFQLQICVPIKIQGFQVVRVINLTKTQAYTACAQSQERVCGSDPVQHVEEWHSVNCTITSDKENVTVAAELSFNQSAQLLRDVTELQILGEISFNRSLYEGLNAENHRTKWTVYCLAESSVKSKPVSLSDILCGKNVLPKTLGIYLHQCGFFKRKYQQLNLESMRRAQLKSEDLFTE